MRILWIHFGLIDDSRLSSTSASARYRCLIPSRELRRQGAEVAFAKAQDITPDALMRVHRPTVVVFTKLSSNSPDEVKSVGARSLALAAAAREGGAAVVSDHCDNRINHPFLGPYYKSLIGLCDGVVASTPDLARLITQQTGKAARVISDPVEGAQRDARFTPPPTPGLAQRLLHRLPGLRPSPATRPRRLELVWFGHPSNFAALAESWGTLQALSRTTPINLHVLTTPTPAVEQFCSRWRPATDACAGAILIPWTEDALWRALHNCDVVFLPCDQDPDKSLAKSPNRVAEALWAGRFVVAHPVPAYQAFADWAWLGPDLTAGVRWALAHPEHVVARIRDAQAYIASAHSPVAITEQWLGLLRELRHG